MLTWIETHTQIQVDRESLWFLDKISCVYAIACISLQLSDYSFKKTKKYAQVGK